MGQGGQEEDRLAEADAAAGVRGSASAMGGGAHLLLVGAEQEDEQRLREAVRKRGGVHLRRDDPFDGKAPSPWLRISKQFQKGNSRKLDFRVAPFPETGFPSKDLKSCYARSRPTRRRATSSTPLPRLK